MSDLDFYSQLLDSLSTAILVLDETLNATYLNPAAEALMEISKVRAKGLGFCDLFKEESPPIAEMKNTLISGQPFTKHEVSCLLPSGHQFTADYTVSLALFGEEPQLIVEFQPRDRLTRISNEEQLLAKQAASKILVRGLAHEIKNPLGGIRGAAQLLDRELGEPELQEYTQIIIEEADRLRHLVDQMLGPHKTFKQEPVNIHEVLERVRQLILAETGDRIQLSRDYDPSIPDIIGDKSQLIQAFLNITRNAMQALKEQEKNDNPEIKVRTRVLRQFTLGQTRFSLVLKVTIADNGPGIPKALVNSIFDPMVSGRPEGTGLGLSITQNIIGQHSGLVECNSSPGDTRFVVLIPIQKP